MGKIDAKVLKELKNRTGAGLMDCKKALEEAGGDFDLAVRILREKGMAKVAKKESREASDGMAYPLIAEDGSKGIVILINCETDFVARTDEFKKFVDETARYFLDREIEWKKDIQIPDEIETKRKEAIVRFGENVQIREWKIIKRGENGLLKSYMHLGGKVGAMVEVAADKDLSGNPEFEEFAKDAVLQVASMNPLAINPEDLPEDYVKENKSIFEEQAKKTGKPENIIQKIVEGKMRKLYEEKVLMYQPFFKDDEKTFGKVVEEYSKKLGANVFVRNFARLGLEA